jgi:serine/threonine-protein kinase
VAEHLSLRTNVVVKFMSRDLADSPDAIARFSREAAAASQVKSPHVVQMLDHGVGEEGAPYIVMELLEGRDLEQHLHDSGALGASEVVGIVAQLARALMKAHDRGIFHRDIKPSNVFLLDAGGGELFVKLLDFGIAKGPEVGIVGSTTRTGSFVGSPYYMSPEQVVGAKNIDFRTDLWSLGVVVYEALTGRKPFYADNLGALALRIHRDALPVPSQENPALTPGVDAWFTRACAREPADRFGSAKEMAEALAVALTGESIPPGLRIDAVPSARASLGLARTEKSDSGSRSGNRSGVDARSETNSRTEDVRGRRRWGTVGGIAAAAAVVGFAVPILVRGNKAPRDDAPSGGAASATASAASSAAPHTTAQSSASGVEAATVQPSANPVASAAAVPAHSMAAVVPTPVANAVPRPTPKPHPSVTSAATPTAAALPSSQSLPVTSHPAASATAAHGSDEDIK